MWYLIAEEEIARQEPVLRYWFGGLEGGGRTIGRKNVDIRLRASSVSRTHATIGLQRAPFRPRTGGIVPTVKDSSAYGTFLKYPRGHHETRATNHDGYHDRLDKDTVVALAEGALLSFGAPSAWWAVKWYPILVYAHGLSHPGADEAFYSRFKRVISVSGLAFLRGDPHDRWAEITHFMTDACDSNSPEFMRALVDGKKIVLRSWAHAVGNMVKNACKAVSVAQSEDAAVSSTMIPPESEYVPSFGEADGETLGHDLLSSVFDRGSRKELFHEMSFAFPDESSHSRWSEVLKAGGARDVFLIGERKATNGVVQVNCIHKIEEGDHTDHNGREGPWCREHDLKVAILANDRTLVPTTGWRKTNEMHASIQCEAATPAPSDSDAETADNDAGDADVPPTAGDRLDEDAVRIQVGARTPNELENGPPFNGRAASLASDRPKNRKQIVDQIRKRRRVRKLEAMERVAEDLVRNESSKPSQENTLPSTEADKSASNETVPSLSQEHTLHQTTSRLQGDNLNPCTYFDVPTEHPEAEAECLAVTTRGESTIAPDVRPFKKVRTGLLRKNESDESVYGLRTEQGTALGATQVTDEQTPQEASVAAGLAEQIKRVPGGREDSELDHVVARLQPVSVAGVQDTDPGAGQTTEVGELGLAKTESSASR